MPDPLEELELGFPDPLVFTLSGLLPDCEFPDPGLLDPDPGLEITDEEGSVSKVLEPCWLFDPKSKLLPDDELEAEPWELFSFPSAPEFELVSVGELGVTRPGVTSIEPVNSVVNSIVFCGFPDNPPFSDSDPG